MVRSMTGFGQSVRTAPGYRLQADLKSVNHRYSEVMVRMPREWIYLEDAVKKLILSEIKRGRVDVFIAMERQGQSGKTIEPDWQLAEAYAEAARQIKERYGFADGLTLKDFLQIPDVIQVREGETADKEQVEQELFACVKEAVSNLAAMREAEGAHLREDLDKRLAVLRKHHEYMVRTAPLVVEEYRTKLHARIQELLGTVPVDESRLAMEVAVFADRSSIEEELTRLDSHFSQFGRLLQSEEPAGRKLDFLIQEMNREVNTIGSKANRAELANTVVELKAELEKIREQVQNIE